MGLGPPVCQHCKVLGELLAQPIPIKKTERTTTYNSHTCWVCPICGETDLREHAGFDLTRFEELKSNEKFLRFMLNKEKK